MSGKRLLSAMPPVSPQALQWFLLAIVYMLQILEEKAKAPGHPLLDRLIERLRHAPREDPSVWDDLQLVADFLEKNRDFSLFDFFDDPPEPPDRIN